MKYYSQNWEQDLFNYILSKGFRVERNVHNFHHNQEIDLFVPALKVGFELNGAFFHNSHKELGKKPLMYHFNKTSDTLLKGIKLYHLWSYAPKEYNVSVIDGALGLSKKIKGTLLIKSIDPKTAKIFLMTNAPYLATSIDNKFYAAFYKDKIVAVLAIQKVNNRLSRIIELKFANFIQLSTAQVKQLLKYSKKCLRFQELEYSAPRDLYPTVEGTFLEKLIQLPGKIIPPKMVYYSVENERAYKRELFTKDLLRKRWPSYKPSLNEEENCFRRCYVRCYDSGSIKVKLAL